ncbi:rolling circle replication-associated protein [Spiroplasma endosymbiont of Stenodema calcarata]|uniref:rolling circle replication-associated protein n=1 Tax=Spiroplasma endosymbiont of Stenodema calcarata TaxID=3139328 RepID=UPI003CCB4857
MCKSSRDNLFLHFFINIIITFKQNINDVIEANKYFKKWIQKLQYRYGGDFKYVRVYEYQRRGAIHYHLIIDRYLELAIPYWLKVVGGMARVFWTNFM